MTVTQLNPDLWLETLIRGIKDYTVEGFDNAFLNDTTPIGSEIFDVIMEFPSTEEIQKRVPLGKTIVHFEVDDIEDRPLGMGENVMEENYDEVTGKTNPQEAREHIVNFDVGIWASDKSGGTTSRLRAYQVLSNLYSGGLAIQRLREATRSVDLNLAINGEVDLLGFTGARFLTDLINDIPVYRMVNCTLIVRCFSRTPKVVEIQTIEDIVLDPDILIEPNLHITD